MTAIPTWVPWAVAAGVGLGVLALAGVAQAREPLTGGGLVDRRAHARLSEEAARHTRSRPAQDVYALVL
ncbi:MAG: hypothetical protein KDK70_17290, partial [Myxococcales bacterium]|nr:hypothetical protein [Myxococcales bacterium]